MKIGLYGGTFNPPHLGHMAAAATAVKQLGLELLLLIPTAIPPHKPLPDDTPNAQQRLEMTYKIADALELDVPVQVLDLELKRAGKSYTIDTLCALRRQYPDDEFFLLLGADLFLIFEQWHAPTDILKQVTLCAFARNDSDNPAQIHLQKKQLEEKYTARISILHIDAPQSLSSTALRAQLAAGEYTAGLLPAVYGYILMHQLYGVKADLKHLPLDALRACALSMIRHKRVAHVLGVEQESISLAKRWGADETLARRSAILHDCTKYFTLEEHLRLCEMYDVALDEIERNTEKLLHAKSGACIAKAVFGESDAVCRAIYCHTTAKENMTVLDKILYLADYIEPNRDFDGVQQLRTLAYEDIDKALLLGIETSIQEMSQRNRLVHPDTLHARTWLQNARIGTLE